MAPPPLDAVRAAFARGYDALARPGRAANADVVVGLDLPDRGGRAAGRPPPAIPPAPPSEWPWWAPAWLELPLPQECPQDAWLFGGGEAVLGHVPCTWFVPVWDGPRGGRREYDPYAVAMLWVEGGSVRRPGRFKTTKTQNTHHKKKLTTKTMQTNPYLNRYLYKNELSTLPANVLDELTALTIL